MIAVVCGDAKYGYSEDRSDNTSDYRSRRRLILKNDLHTWSLALVEPYCMVHVVIIYLFISAVVNVLWT